MGPVKAFLVVRSANFGVTRSGIVRSTVVRSGVRRGAATRVWSDGRSRGRVCLAFLVRGVPLVGRAVLIPGRVGAFLTMRVSVLAPLVVRVLTGFAVRAGGLTVIRVGIAAVVVLPGFTFRVGARTRGWFLGRVRRTRVGLCFGMTLVGRAVTIAGLVGPSLVIR